MNKLISILIICALIGQNAVQLGILFWYEVNKDYVSAVLCENKDKPKMHCNGKCYLKKQMKKAEDKSSKSSETKNGKQELVCYILMDFNPLICKPIFLHQNHSSVYNVHFPNYTLYPLLRPPQQASKV